MSMGNFVVSVVAFGVLLNGATRVDAIDLSNLNEVVLKMQGIVLDGASELERLYSARCHNDVITRCARGNYDGCTSKFPSLQCLQGEDLTPPDCGDGKTCAALFDLETSLVLLHKDIVADEELSLVENPSVVESVCFSQGMDEYWARKRKEDEPFWNSLGVSSPQVFFGSVEGMMRWYPGRPVDICGTFDPRIRPWYIAASSGPKNVILILDTSGSMEGLRIEFLKQAAKRVVNTLTFADHVAMVTFAREAKVTALEGKYVYTATAANKEILLRAIDEIEAKSSTNFLSAFEEAFKILENSIDEERQVICSGGVSGNTAILFLTDGEATEPQEWSEVERENATMTVVSEGLQRLEDRLGRPPFLFTYSVADKDMSDGIHMFPKQLACATTENGIWSQITDDRQIVESLSSYYRLFTVGLGEGNNADFTAWVEPYKYVPKEIVGTTVAAPVYDRSKSPPIFLGVMGADIPLEALDSALGVSRDDPNQGQARNVSLARVIQASTAFCPDVALTHCEFESVRRRGLAGDDALCSNDCTDSDFVEIETEPCAILDDYPSDLFANRGEAGLSYTQRACCKPGVDAATDHCPYLPEGSDSLPLGVIVGVAAGACLLFVTLGFVAFRRRRTREQHEKEVSSNSDSKNSKSKDGKGQAPVEVPNVHIIQPSLDSDQRDSSPPSRLQGPHPRRPEPGDDEGASQETPGMRAMNELLPSYLDWKDDLPRDYHTVVAVPASTNDSPRSIIATRVDEAS